MFALTEDARKELEAFFTGKEKQTIRVHAVSSCAGPRLALALDEPNDKDVTGEADGFSFCMDKELQAEAGSISIDLSYMGFVVTPEKPLSGGGGCSSCGGGCSSCQS